MAAGSPCPARTARDGEVVIPKGEDGADEADEVAEEDVEGVVPEIPPAGAGNVD